MSAMLLSQIRRGLNFSALLTEEVQKSYQEDQAATLVKLAEDQRLRPEHAENLEPLKSYAGPLLARLKNGGWIVLVNSRQLDSEVVTLFEPGAGNNLLNVPKEKVMAELSGEIIIFRNQAQVDAAQQTRLTAFVSLARHHNSPVDIRELMHEYAIGDKEVGDSLFARIVREHGFKMKKTKLSWDKLFKSQSVVPCIIVKSTGKYAVFCGFRKNQDETFDAVVVDPESDKFNTPDHFIFLNKEDFLEQYGNQFILLKRVYKLSDDNQPFSLRWFIPEFLRQKSLFGKIALMVVILTAFSLVIPLFFQFI